MATQCQFGGEFYYALTDVLPGESPATNPEKWQLLYVPRQLRPAIAQLAYSLLLASEGNNDKRGIEARNAQALLDDAIGNDSRMEGRRTRSVVFTR